jgi:Hypothetical glycosyl hydrolase family 15
VSAVLSSKRAPLRRDQSTISGASGFGVCAVVGLALVSALVFGVGSASSRRDAATRSSFRQTGLGVVRFDFNLRRSWITNRYSYVIVGPSDTDRVRSFHGLALIYKSAMGVDTRCGAPGSCVTGVTYSEARRNGWVLRAGSGSEIGSASYAGVRLADVGSRAYQRRWLRNVLGYLRAQGAHGLFIDEVAANVGLWSGGVRPAKYPTDDDWERAMVSFVSYVGPRLRQHGIYVVASALKYVSGDRGTDNGTLDRQWWRRIGASVDGLGREYWQQNPEAISQVYTENPARWTGHWSGWLKLVATAQAMGKGFFGIQRGPSSDVRLLRYGRASFLLEWNGRQGAYMFFATDRTEPSNTDWAVPIGAPLGRKHRVGTGWLRRFSRGVVVLNPSETVTQSFALGGMYALRNGAPMTSVALPPATALILRKR